MKYTLILLVLGFYQIYLALNIGGAGWLLLWSAFSFIIVGMASGLKSGDHGEDD